MSGWGVAYRLRPPTSPGVGWTQTIMHGFTALADGYGPVGPLVAFGGSFYGATAGGSSTATIEGQGNGTIYRLGAPVGHDGSYTETILYDFAGGNDGANPNGGLIVDPSGTLYGTTGSGGGACSASESSSGCGTVFKLTPPAAPGETWTETRALQLPGRQRRGLSRGRARRGPGGKPLRHHGIRRQAGLRRRLGAAHDHLRHGLHAEPPRSVGLGWTETVLYRFTNHLDGAAPMGPVLYSHGTLYGTSRGLATAGAVFRLTPPKVAGGAWTETTLHHFNNTHTDRRLSLRRTGHHADGAADVLIGTTSSGGIVAEGCFAGPCGTVYELTQPIIPGGAWTLALLYRFTGGNDGGLPYGGVILDRNGVIYGTTAAGGTFFNCEEYPDLGCGAVFSLTPIGPPHRLTPVTRWRRAVRPNSRPRRRHRPASSPS